jgi:protein-S-isoprenylcysteine O-methyltransferase Ste14
LLGLLYRIKIEERVLFDGFGEEYGRYMRDTSRLIPRVW